MKIVNDIDSGNSNIDESQTIEIASAIGELVSRYNKPKIPNKLTRLEACRHLRVSETKFNMLRRKGLISEGTKKAGDVRKWSIEELDKYIKENCKKEKVITVLKQYINNQLDTINTPIISFFKPIIKRIIDNNINKVNSFLDLIKDDNDEIDVIGLLEEMTTSLVDSNEFDYSIFHIGNGKVTMSLFNQKISLTTSDIDLLKSMFNN